MTKKCCVTQCQGNYTNYKQVYKISKDLNERKRCLSVIPRDNILDHKGTVVCEEH